MDEIDIDSKDFAMALDAYCLKYEMTLISNDHYEKLKEIEWMYNDLE